MTDPNYLAQRAAGRQLIERIMSEHSVRKNFRRHVQSVLQHCGADESLMLQSISQLYANCRQSFY